MSGHSKWANIKNRKGAQDKKRSEAFTKMAKNILTAIRSGGGNTSPEANNLLKTAIDRAKEVYMPKENIERLIARFEERKANLVTMTLEGFGPFGVPMVVEVETDNKNRILSEIKLIFRNHQGALGEGNSVAFLFDRVGEIELEVIPEDKELLLIDAGAEDFEGNTVITKAEDVGKMKEKATELGLKVINFGVIMKAKNPIMLQNEDEVAKMMDFISELEENEDVIQVFAGFDFKEGENVEKI
jgi:YebC/PmpR family DNA-binding regulatory protein